MRVGAALDVPLVEPRSTAQRSERLAVLLRSLGQRRAIHLRENRSSVAHTMCIIGPLNSADEIFAPYRRWRASGISRPCRSSPQSMARSTTTSTTNAISTTAKSLNSTGPPHWPSGVNWQPDNPREQISQVRYRYSDNAAVWLGTIALHGHVISIEAKPWASDRLSCCAIEVGHEFECTHGTTLTKLRNADCARPA